MMSSKVNCARCGFQNVPYAKFCSECGFTLVPSGITDKFDNWVDADDQQVISIKNHLSTLEDREFLLYIPHIQDTLKFSRHLILLLGRAPRCVTPVDRTLDLSEFVDAKQYGISRRHAAISYWDGQYTIQDLGSVNGTKLNAKFISPEKKYELHDGDTITLGTLVLIFRYNVGDHLKKEPKKLADTK